MQVVDGNIEGQDEGSNTPQDIGREVTVASKTTCKHQRQPSQWARVQSKQKRARGVQYLDAKQRLVAAKAIGQPCTCKRKCFVKIGERIKLIFEGFLKLESKDKQDAYLFALISSSPTAQHRPRTDERERSQSYYYRVKTPECDVVVCKQAFMSIHSISPKQLRRLCEHSAVYSTPPTDKRGQHDNHHHIDAEVVTQIRAHIESFPAQESHYSRSDNHGKKFLSENLNIPRLYHLYLEKFEPDQLERIQQGLPFSGTVKKHFYR